MQLKYNKTIRNKVITLELETVNFTTKEKQLIEQYGEPIIKFEKVYLCEFPVEFERRIMNGFKIRVKFNGSNDVDKAADAANLFFEEIQEELYKAMLDLEDQYLEANFKSESGIITID